MKINKKDMTGYVNNVGFLQAEKGIEVFKLEGERITPREENAPHKHEYQEFIWVTEGGGTHIIDGVEYPITPYSFHIVKKWQVHKVILDKGSKGVVVLFDDDLFFSGSPAFSQYKYYFSNPVIKCNVLQVNETDRLFYQSAINELYALFTANIEWGKYLLLQKLVESVLIKSLHLMADQYDLKLDFNNSLEEISSFFVLLNQYYKSEHEVNFYADQMHLSVRRLNAMLKENFGKTIREMLNDRIISEAKRMLTYSNLTVKEIAFLLGFQDPSYFSRLFRQKCEVSPSEYRG